MIHPEFLAQYLYRRHACQVNAIDACIDTAASAGFPVATLATFLVTVGIDARVLSLIV